MSRPFASWLELQLPRDITPEQALAALLTLNGASTPKRSEPILVEVAADRDGLHHRLAVPEGRAKPIGAQLQTALPGLGVLPIDPPKLEVAKSWQAWQSHRGRSLSTGHPDATAAALLTALAAVRGPESLVAQWLLGPVLRPSFVPSRLPANHSDSLLVSIVRAPFAGPGDMDAEHRRALRQKQGLPGWRACLRLGVKAGGVERQRQLLGGLAAAVRTAQGPGVQLGFRSVPRASVVARRRPWRWPLTINSMELVGLVGLPLSNLSHLPLNRVRSRLLPPSRRLARTGYVIGEASYPGQHRPVALSVVDASRHLHLLGATGSGKSTVALNLVVQAMQANRSVVVIEPKDLVNDVLARVPEDRVDDVVLIDPLGQGGAITPFNPLMQAGVASEVIADQVLTVFKGIFGEAIGPRSSDVLTAGLLTLVNQPESSPARSLVALPLLFGDPAFRGRLLSHIKDPLGIGQFWAWWDSQSQPAQAAIMAAPSNKLRSFLVRAPLRRTVGPTKGSFDLRQLFTKRRILLFNLRPGSLGPETANLLASLALSQLWQAALGRTAVPAEKRSPVLVVADEFQNYLHLAQDFSDVLVQARALGLQLVLSHQFLGQLRSPELKAAVTSNARSKIIFNVGQEDATQLARSDGRLSAEDFTGLGAFEAYASLLSNNESTPWASIRTLPPPPATADPEAVAEASARHWGQPAEQIDHQLERLAGLDGQPDSKNIGRRKRGNAS